MPQIIVTRRAMDGIRRCRNFLDKADIKIIRQAMDAIDRQFSALENSPEIGRPFANNPDLRELVYRSETPAILRSIAMTAVETLF